MHVNAWMRVDWRRSPNTYVRCGWTVPGYVGSAVLRNRFKRWGREYMRKWARSHSVGLDMNVVLKRKDPEFYRSLRHKEFVRALETMVGKLQRSMGS